MLNPFSQIAFSPADRERVAQEGIVALDCSWEHAEKVLSHHVRGTARCLPVLLAGNPTNYAKATKLSTAEAIAGALYIAGFREDAEKVLSVFSWGHTFLELNAMLLDAYAQAKDSAEIVEVMKAKLGNQPHKPPAQQNRKKILGDHRSSHNMRHGKVADDFEDLDE